MWFPLLPVLFGGSRWLTRRFVNTHLTAFLARYWHQDFFCCCFYRNKEGFHRRNLRFDRWNVSHKQANSPNFTNDTSAPVWALPMEIVAANTVGVVLRRITAERVASLVSVTVVATVLSLPPPRLPPAPSSPLPPQSSPLPLPLRHLPLLLLPLLPRSLPTALVVALASRLARDPLSVPVVRNTDGVERRRITVAPAVRLLSVHALKQFLPAGCFWVVKS